MSDRDLRRLLAPRSIAVVGGAPAEQVVRQCRLLGFDGAIWPVHPTRVEFDGVPCFPSLDALPGVPDAVFLGVNRHATVTAMTSLAATGAGGAVCYGSGFAEAGEAGTALQHALVAAAATMPFLGPNCYGYVNAFDGVALWPDEHGCRRLDRGVAVVAQSGNVGLNLTFQQRGLRLGYMVTVGNQADIGIEDCLEALLDDVRVTAVGIYIEGVRNSQRFGAALVRAAASGIPVVALHTGRSAAGARIAASHTAALAGHRAAYAALFERYGVISVDTPSELIETLALLDNGGPLTGNRIVAMSSSGGEASLIADRADGSGLEFPPFTDEHRQRIEPTLTDLVNISNPFDYHTFMWGDRAAMARCFTAVMDGPQDATVLVLDAPPAPANDASAWLVALDALVDAAAATGRRAVVLSTLAECLSEPLRDRALAAGIAPLHGLADGLRALAGAASWSEQPSSTSMHAPARPIGTTRVVDEATAKGRIAEFGIAVPAGIVVAPGGNVAKAAAAIGYPVTVKSLGLLHKSDAVGVVVGVADEEALVRAMASMPATPTGTLIEATVGDVIAEMLVSVRSDPPVGWLVTLGPGGVMTELLRDTVHLLAPVTIDDVTTALTKLRTYPILDGFRGRAPADIDALATLVVRLADAVVGDTSAVEVELNPVLVGRDGAVAVDALWIETETETEIEEQEGKER
ncbi:MAG TPA: acetate--CoA ligase family protein [Ilumatobacteraceae bacterium]